MGVLLLALFLLSNWHFWWTRGWFYLCSSSHQHVKSCAVFTSVPVQKVFFSSLAQALFWFTFKIGSSVINIRTVPLSLQCFPTPKMSVFPREWLIQYLFYHSLLTANITLFVLYVWLIFVPFFVFCFSLAPCFQLFTVLQLLSTYVWACGKNPALGPTFFFFHVRTSGDIKGLQHCLFASAQLLLTALRIVASARFSTHSLPDLNIRW